tara:strand:+ start:1669 stop:3879 length:2211 start_codon:yes stop_codon:yes gene_type:complete
MAGPTNQTTVQLTIPPGQAEVQYSATLLAQRVENFELTPEDTLISTLGVAPYDLKAPWESTLPVFTIDVDTNEATASEKIPQKPRSVFHVMLQRGATPMLLARFGGTLWRYMGGASTNIVGPWQSLANNLNNDDQARFPDQYVVMNDQVIWTNGVDQARVISYNNMVTPLGYSDTPAPPTVFCPSQPRKNEVPRHLPNTIGYSWHGDIGTAGDTLDGRTGALLTGEWYYYTQYEDVHGNLSPFSQASNPARLATIQADPYDPEETGNPGTEISDLTRSFLVNVMGNAPEHTTAIRVFRTPDTKQVSAIPQFLQRFAGSEGFVYGDKRSDASLGTIWQETVPVPAFHVMCTHQGSLVIGNTSGDPGLVRKSQPGFPGTFNKLDFVYPDSGGAAVTGLVSHGGMLLAFTETSVYSLQDFSAPVPLSKGIGCVAPSTIQATPEGTLIWLGRDGFYALSGGAITKISQPIQETMRYGINRGLMNLASASVDAVNGEYRCAIAPAGNDSNRLVLVFDGSHWRVLKLGYHIADICQTDDWRQYNLIAAEAGQQIPSATAGFLSDLIPTTSNVYVLGRERSDYRELTQNIRVARYRSAWIRGDDTALTPLNIRSLYLGMVDAWDDVVGIRFYKNGSWTPVREMSTVLSVGVDNDSGVIRDIAGKAVIKAFDEPDHAKLHRPRLYWRQVPVDLQNVNTWAFEVSAFTHTYGNVGKKLHLAAFAFDMSVATTGNPRGRIPFSLDK